MIKSLALSFIFIGFVQGDGKLQTRETSYPLAVPSQRYLRPKSALILTQKLLKGQRLIMQEMLSKAGFEVTLWKTVDPFDPIEDFDLIWMQKTPSISLLEQIGNSQRINHIKAAEIFTSKMKLNILVAHPAVPECFIMTDDFQEKFTERNKEDMNKLWLRKSMYDGDVEVLTARQLLEKDAISHIQYVQEYIDEPMLIDGHKFDLAMQTIITSVHPLRAYYFDAELWFRAALAPYYPIDLNDQRKMVVNPKNLNLYPKNIFQMPSLKDAFIRRKLSIKWSIFEYMRKMGQDPEVIYQKMKDIFTEVLRKAMPNLQAKTMQLIDKEGNSSKFFEVNRFDYLIRNNGDVYLIEANMSPIMAPYQSFVDSSGPRSAIPKQAAHMDHCWKHYHDIFAITGITKCSYCNDSIVEKPLQDDINADVHLPFPFCKEKVCAHKDVNDYRCELCAAFMPSRLRLALEESVREHHNRFGFRRAYPPPTTQDMSFNELVAQIQQEQEDNKIKYSDMDNQLRVWYFYKCKADPNWCS